MSKQTHDQYMQGRQVFSVLTAEVETEGLAPVQKLITPNMAQDAHVIIDRPELVPQGLRLGDWSQVTK